MKITYGLSDKRQVVSFRSAELARKTRTAGASYKKGKVTDFEIEQ